MTSTTHDLFMASRAAECESTLSPIPSWHHDLRARGANTCFALEVLEAHVYAWGDWALHGRTLWE